LSAASFYFQENQYARRSAPAGCQFWIGFQATMSGASSRKKINATPEHALICIALISVACVLVEISNWDLQQC
jgi:hypothetical protein